MGRIASIANAPVLWKAGWVPESEWDDLDELRETHERLLAARDDAAQRVLAARDSFESEDAERSQRLQAGYRAGEPVELPPPTSPEDRRAAIAAAVEEAKAAEAAFVSFLNDAVAKVAE